MSKRKNATHDAGIAALDDAPAPDVGSPSADGSQPVNLLPPASNGPAEPTESKSEKFVRLANRRVNNAIKAIGYVRNLANRATYEYKQEQVESLLAVLESAVQNVKFAFDNHKEEKKGWSL